MSLPERIKFIRGGKPQEALAKELGVSTVTFGRWERGERVPDAEDLNRILQIYPDINPTWLLTGEGEVKKRDLPSRLVEFAVRKYSGTVNGDMLNEIVGLVNEACLDLNYRLIPENEAGLILLLYDLYENGVLKGTTIDKETVIRYVKFQA